MTPLPSCPDCAARKLKERARGRDYYSRNREKVKAKSLKRHWDKKLEGYAQ